MKKIALAVCAASLLFGASKYDYELTPLIGYGFTHGENTKNEAFFGGRIARNLDLPWLSQIELGAEFAPRVKYKDSAKHYWNYWNYWNYFKNNDDYSRTNVWRVYLDLVKIWEVNDTFGVYGLVGVGYQGYQHRNEDTKNGGFAQVGLGLRFNLNEQVALKLEARELISFNRNRHKELITLGLGIGLGERYTPAPEPVIGDEDMDGVKDNIDRCPGTPRGHVVDEWGCEKVIRLELDVLFAFDSDKIAPAYEGKIKEVSDLLNAHPDYTVILEGHTDSVGTAQYNQGLSERRAAAVAKVLMKDGVAANRISTVGYGKTKPIATNATKEGRAKNRRVDARFRK